MVHVQRVGFFYDTQCIILGQDWILKIATVTVYILPRDQQLNFCPNRPSSLSWKGAATHFEGPLFLMRFHLYLNVPFGRSLKMA
jgi:hypothetical protein